MQNQGRCSSACVLFLIWDLHETHFNNWKLLYSIMGFAVWISFEHYWFLESCSLSLSYPDHLSSSIIVNYSVSLTWICTNHSLLKHHNNIYFHQEHRKYLSSFHLLFASSCLPKIHYIHCHIFLLLSGW